MSAMERKTTYRFLLVLVLILTVFYTLGLVGVVPFKVSYYITIFMIVLFVLLRWDYHRGERRE
ncbi:Conserved hypothetical protein [Thermococcus gammatolerans EJ3]|uniref:Uncharacterized protein n=2 Tax=Thermococcus TaxID=2263 RepID=C5A455_THEGJ|nr:Conserved hypothetical protein [Thermococcus gammatolerans EJ3]